MYIKFLTVKENRLFEEIHKKTSSMMSRHNLVIPTLNNIKKNQKEKSQLPSMGENKKLKMKREKERYYIYYFSFNLGRYFFVICLKIRYTLLVVLSNNMKLFICYVVI